MQATRVVGCDNDAEKGDGHKVLFMEMGIRKIIYIYILIYGIGVRTLNFNLRYLDFNAISK